MDSVETKQELWKTIKGFEDYQVSTFGNVWSKKKKQIIQTQTIKGGYKRVRLRKKWLFVHQLVARAFIYDPEPWEELEVNHLDFNPSNNRVENLQWCDHAYNMHYSKEAGRLKRKDVEL